jgi:hypothetical protein
MPIGSSQSAFVRSRLVRAALLAVVVLYGAVLRVDAI